LDKIKNPYNLVKIIGLATFIPFVLASGTLGGYFLGEYLKKNFNLNAKVADAFILVGLSLSLLEATRIIKELVKLGKKI
jgi:hypothetical protein